MTPLCLKGWLDFNGVWARGGPVGSCKREGEESYQEEAFDSSLVSGISSWAERISLVVDCMEWGPQPGKARVSMEWGMNTSLPSYQRCINVHINTRPYAYGYGNISVRASLCPKHIYYQRPVLPKSRLRSTEKPIRLEEGSPLAILTSQYSHKHNHMVSFATTNNWIFKRINYSNRSNEMKS